MPGEVLNSQFHTAYIALGSNLGNLKENLLHALALLEEAGIKIVRVSSFIMSEPYGVLDQPKFLNAVSEIRTSLSPLDLLQTLLKIEQRMGRVRLRHWGERNIDLDLLFYEDVCINTKKLQLPHPDIANRDFVLKPLAEIAPLLVHPVLGKTIIQLWQELRMHWI